MKNEDSYEFKTGEALAALQADGALPKWGKIAIRGDSEEFPIIVHHGERTTMDETLHAQLDESLNGAIKEYVNNTK